MTTTPLGSVDFHIVSDEKTNSYVMWVELEPHVAARVPIGARGTARRNGHNFHVIVIHVDQAKGRVYVLPRAAVAWPAVQ